jgi:hypothetical protein
MKIKYEFAISEVAGEKVAVSVGVMDRNMVITLNHTAELFFSALAQDISFEALVATLMEAYEDLDESTARADTEEFLQLLRDNDLLDE